MQLTSEKFDTGCKTPPEAGQNAVIGGRNVLQLFIGRPVEWGPESLYMGLSAGLLAVIMRRRDVSGEMRRFRSRDN